MTNDGLDERSGPRGPLPGERAVLGLLSRGSRAGRGATGCPTTVARASFLFLFGRPGSDEGIGGAPSGYTCPRPSRALTKGGASDVGNRPGPACLEIPGSAIRHADLLRLPHRTDPRRG